jgi:hypothetical protein
MPAVGGKPRGPVTQPHVNNSNASDSDEFFTPAMFRAVRVLRRATLADEFVGSWRPNEGILFAVHGVKLGLKSPSIAEKVTSVFRRPLYRICCAREAVPGSCSAESFVPFLAFRKYGDREILCLTALINWLR